MTNTTTQDISEYFKARILELKEMATGGAPWSFLCCSAVIDYFTCLVNNEKSTRTNYIKFIKEYLSKVKIEYKSFQYKSGAADLPEQMYSVLRCGIVHNFSLVPDEKSVRNGGRIRSIVLCHKREGLPHLSNFSNANIADAALFVSEEFADDLEKLNDYIFKKSEEDAVLNENILKWREKHPPILGI